MSFTPLGDTLHNKIGKNSSKKDQSEEMVIVNAAESVFKELFGAEIASQAKPLFLKNRTLTVSCSSSASAQEIRDNQPEIVEKINEELGEKLIDRIRYLA